MSRDTSFYYSFLVLPPRKRRAIVAVWDFCRAVDDAVDEVVPEQSGRAADASARRATALAMWRDGAERLLRRARPATPQGQALQPYVREFNLPRQQFEDADRRRGDGSRRTSRYPTSTRWPSTAAASRRPSA